MNKSQK